MHLDAYCKPATARLCDETILRLGGDVYVTGMTWTSDDRQVVAFIDGAGWPERPADHYYSSRLATVSGEPRNAVFKDVPGYPDIPLCDIYKRTVPLYYGFSVLAVEGCIYQYLSTSTMHCFTPELNVLPDFHLNAVKVIYSPDNGRTWCNQNAPSPVVRELHDEQTAQTMVFLREPRDAFPMLSFLQMGRDYQENRDGFAYAYAPNGITEGTMNEMVMFRVSKEKILDRSAYEFYAGRMGNGEARWSNDLDARAVVHTFPPGWVHSNYSFSWVPSVVYNGPLGLYIMANASSADPTGAADDGCSYLGLWVSAHPWGTWEQIYETTAWTPSNDTAARAGTPIISPRWIAEDGKSFWLVWNDAQLKSCDSDSPTEETLIASMRSTDDSVAFNGRSHWRRHHPGWSFNTQRVDLVLR
jgi:hypothetical protein